MMELPYLPGRAPETTLPLARFLPPLPMGVGRAWVQTHLPPGAWVLDPFGASPALAAELARAGCRVLIAANNPIVRFLLEMHAAPPTRDECLAALETLASARKGEAGERLEPHLLSLYATPCAQCGTDIPADAFLWEKDAEAPFARVYTCPHCESSGEFPATEADAALAARYATGSSAPGLHRARALERVLPLNDPDREHVEEALRSYPPRAVYALFTLINKLDGLPITPRQRNLIAALLLTTFDQTNTLWPYPAARARPKQLTVPPKFIERNVWRALEAAVSVWEGLQAGSVSLVRWPEHPAEQGGVTLFDGRLKDLADSLPADIAAVVTTIPRPNQAFWTLSALWSGWLWGPEAIGPFRAVLRRRRYDWAWHTEALHAVLRRLSVRLPKGTPLFGMVPEAEPGLMTSTFTAGDLAGLVVEGLALREEDERRLGVLGQVTWRVGTRPKKRPLSARQRTGLIRSAAQTLLQARGEPVPYLHLHTAALTGLARYGAFADPALEPGDAYPQVRDAIEHALAEKSGLVRLGGSPHALDVGAWWLEEPGRADAPLCDRVEKALAKLLANQPGQSMEDLEKAVCRQFPGLLTPEHELVRECLESYGVQVDGGLWVLRGEEEPGQREGDAVDIRQRLLALGERLGFATTPGQEVVWSNQAGETARFVIQTSAAIGRMTGDPVITPLAFLVIPGGRANLLLYKIRRDPRLAGGGWQFLKFRHVRQLANSAELTPENWLERFALDPLTYESAQMRLL